MCSDAHLLVPVHQHQGGGGKVDAPDDAMVGSDLAILYADISNMPNDLDLLDEEPKLHDGFMVVGGDWLH